MELIEIPLRRLGAPGAPSPWANTPRFAWRDGRQYEVHGRLFVCRRVPAGPADDVDSRWDAYAATGMHRLRQLRPGDFGPLIWDGKARRREDLYRDMNLFRAGYREPEPVGCYELRLMVSLTDQVRGLHRGRTGNERRRRKHRPPQSQGQSAGDLTAADGKQAVAKAKLFSLLGGSSGRSPELPASAMGMW